MNTAEKLESKIDLLLERLPEVDTSKAWTYSDTAKFLGCSSSTVRRMEKLDGFPRMRVVATDDEGRSIKRFVAAEVVNWFERSPKS